MGESKWTDERIVELLDRIKPIYRQSSPYLPRHYVELTIRHVRDDMQATIDGLQAQLAQAQQELEALRGDDWGATVDYLISLAPEPEPPLPEPPDDWDEDSDEDNPHYDTPRGY